MRAELLENQICPPLSGFCCSKLIMSFCFVVFFVFFFYSRDFNAEPELMPKTPSQKKNSRRKRVSVGRQEEGQVRRR